MPKYNVELFNYEIVFSFDTAYKPVFDSYIY